MIKLPATFVEAEALIFARNLVAMFARTASPWSSDLALTAEAGHAVFRRMLGLSLQFTQTRMHLIEAAKAGDPDAIEMLRAVLLECKAQRTEMSEMPSDLIAYDMHVTAHGGERRKKKPGPKKKSFLSRDLHIAITVAAVVDCFPLLRPTGRSPRSRSACAIVAEALGVANMKLSESEVEAIWRTYRGGMPTERNWASSWKR